MRKLVETRFGILVQLIPYLRQSTAQIADRLRRTSGDCGQVLDTAVLGAVQPLEGTAQAVPLRVVSTGVPHVVRLILQWTDMGTAILPESASNGQTADEVGHHSERRRQLASRQLTRVVRTGLISVHPFRHTVEAIGLAATVCDHRVLQYLPTYAARELGLNGGGQTDEPSLVEARHLFDYEYGSNVFTCFRFLSESIFAVLL